jgi:hypothetical protein
MDTQFSSNALCHDVTFIRFPWGLGDVNEKVKLLKQSHWYFFIPFYTTGNEFQPWTLASSDTQRIFKGDSSPKEIAQEVCALIMGSVGSIFR